MSTTKDEQQLSLDAQERWAREYAAKHKLSLTEPVYIERFSAGSVTKRKVLTLLLKQLEATPPRDRPSVLIITAVDRLSRDVFDTGYVAFILRDLKVRLVTKEKPEGYDFNTRDMSSSFDYLLRGLAGQGERAARSRLTSGHWERQREAGLPTTAKAPYGLQYQNKDFVAAEGGSAEAVRMAFELYASGIGMYRIALQLSELGAVHKYRTSVLDAGGQPVYKIKVPRWEPNRVKKLLVGRYYRGRLIDNELYDNVQARLAAKPRIRSDRKNEYPWSGAIKCCGCGRSFHGHTSGAVRRKLLSTGVEREYINSKPVRYYHCTVCNYSINADRLETWVRDLLHKFRAQPDLIKNFSGSDQTTSDVASNKQLIAKLESETHAEVIAERRRLTWEMARQSKAAAEFLGEELTRIDQEQRDKLSRLNELRAAIANVAVQKRTTANAVQLLEDFWTLFDAATYDERRNLAEAVVSSIGAITASRDGLSFAPRR